MSRVIQDSDDELDDNIEVDIHKTEAQDASPKQSTNDASSTEALRRQIEAAHRAHLQSQYTTLETSTSTTFNENHPRRKAPVEFDSRNPSTGIGPSKKSPVTYGKRPKGAIGSLPADLQQDRSLADQISQQTEKMNETDWMLQGTMREAYAQHNPNAMFPEPSSTVPNATLTQQRVMEGILPPALLGSDTDVGSAHFQPDASIPWSEYLKSPTNTGEQPKSSAQCSQVSQNTLTSTSGPLPNVGPNPSISQSNRRLSLTLVGSPSTQENDVGVAYTQELATLSTEGVAFEATPLQTTQSSTINTSIRGKTANSSRQERKTMHSASSEPASDDELAGWGLPKEQYKPRPSRSRSSKAGIQEPIDYSVRPEKATNPSRRRKSTPAATNVANPLSTPDRIKQICEMGFTPATSARALEQNNGDVTQSVDWLITSGAADDELVTHKSPMLQADKIQAEASSGNTEHDGNRRAGHVVENKAALTDQGVVSNNVNCDIAIVEAHTVSPVAELKTPAKVQVVIPAKSPNSAVDTSIAPEMPRKRAKRRKTTLDQPEPIEADDAMTLTKFERKRGRGRPKKEAKTAEILYEEKEGSREQVRDSPLLSVDGNARPAWEQPQNVVDELFSETTAPVRDSGSPQVDYPKAASATSKSTPEPQELPDRPEVEPITPERVKKPAPRERPSTNKAKVSYRVGLSKRTRIAPLLRVIKK